jgi:hypothetical protein
MLDDFYSKLFVKEDNSLSQIQNIISWDEFADAVRNCTTSLAIKSKWKENFDKFIADSIKTT